jgi:hypothetical protein
MPFPPHQSYLAVDAPLLLIGRVTDNTQGTSQAPGQGQVRVSSLGQELLHDLDTQTGPLAVTVYYPHLPLLPTQQGHIGQKGHRAGYLGRSWNSTQSLF